jgi:hypothetical protein
MGEARRRRIYRALHPELELPQAAVVTASGANPNWPVQSPDDPTNGKGMTDEEYRAAKATGEFIPVLNTAEARFLGGMIGGRYLLSTELETFQARR